MMVTSGIIQQNGKYLIAQRQKGDDFELRWEFPGGKIKPDETPGQALKRELKEELDLEITVHDLVKSIEDVHSSGVITISYYNVTVNSGSYTLTAHEQIKWVPLEQLDEFDFLGADKKLIEHLRIR